MLLFRFNPVSGNGANRIDGDGDLCLDGPAALMLVDRAREAAVLLAAARFSDAAEGGGPVPPAGSFHTKASLMVLRRPGFSRGAVAAPLGWSYRLRRMEPGGQMGEREGLGGKRSDGVGGCRSGGLDGSDMTLTEWRYCVA